MIVNPAILDEIRLLAERRKFEPYRNALRELLDIVQTRATVVREQRAPSVLPRDSNDTHLLGTLLASKADWLVTGDADLLVLSSVYPIIDATRFLERLSPHR